jgi:hypothetical protein
MDSEILADYIKTRRPFHFILSFCCKDIKEVRAAIGQYEFLIEIGFVFSYYN